MGLPVWAGVLPVTTSYGTPEPAPDLDPAVKISDVVTRYHRPAR
jgi:hypothetical protein